MNNTGVDRKKWFTYFAASTLQTPGRQLMQIVSGGERQGSLGQWPNFGAGLGLPRLTGDGADDGTSNDAGVRGATGRAGCSIARGARRTVRGGWSCWKRSWSS